MPKIITVGGNVVTVTSGTTTNVLSVTGPTMVPFVYSDSKMTTATGSSSNTQSSLYNTIASGSLSATDIMDIQGQITGTTFETATISVPSAVVISTGTISVSILGTTVYSATASYFPTIFFEAYHRRYFGTSGTIKDVYSLAATINGTTTSYSLTDFTSNPLFSLSANVSWTNYAQFTSGTITLRFMADGTYSYITES